MSSFAPQNTADRGSATADRRSPAAGDRESTGDRRPRL